MIRETFVAGATAQAVADRHEIGTSLIYTWRKQMLRASMASFAAVEIKPDVRMALPGSVEPAAALPPVTVATDCRIIERHARQHRGRTAARRLARGRRLAGIVRPGE